MVQEQAKQSTSKREEQALYFLLVAYFACSLTLRFEAVRSSKQRYIFTRRHGVTSEKNVLFELTELYKKLQS
jgi:hypothetical protein